MKVNNIILDEEVLTEKFACDLEKCKGACCTFPGEYGAPVLDEEVELLKESFGVAKQYLSEKSLSYIEKHGLVEGVAGNYSTVCINKRDCVFVYYEKDVAKCSIEKGYFEGKNRFRKPISCHLFPVRVARDNPDYIYYVRISECNPAREKTVNEGKHLYVCLKDAFIRAFGSEWYKALAEQAKVTAQKKNLFSFFSER
ncbi:MAG: DUF3109 family protein [Bacteroidota bacterium]